MPIYARACKIGKKLFLFCKKLQLSDLCRLNNKKAQPFLLLSEESIKYRPLRYLGAARRTTDDIGYD
jgi:hypothetical protein